MESGRRPFESFLAILVGSSVLTIYIEVLAKSAAGTVASLVLAACLALVSLRSLKHGIVATWAIAVLVPEYPRDILDVYEALQVFGSVEYNVISSVTVGPGSLILDLFILNSVLAAAHFTKIRVGPWKLIGVTSVLLVGTVGLLVDLVAGERRVAFGAIITDLKFPLLLLMGLIQGAYLRAVDGESLLAKVILALPLYLGTRAVLFIASDFVQTVPKLDVMNHPLLSTAVLAFLMVQGLKTPYLGFVPRGILYLSLFSASRGLLAIQTLFLSVLLLVRKKKGSRAGRRVLEIVAIVSLFVGTVAIASPRLFDFLLWKLSDVSVLAGDAELSGSGQVRAYELMNISSVAFSSPLTSLFGKGFGGTFDFRQYPLPGDVELDLKSYSERELESGVFYNPHSFISAILLKYGVVGLALYLLFAIYVATVQARSPAPYGLLFAFIAILMIYNYYWRIEYMFLMGVLLGMSGRRHLKPIINESRGSDAQLQGTT